MLLGDIYDSQDRKIGAGPLWSLTGATISRALDGAGSVTTSAPGTEARAIDLLQNERRIRIYTWQPGPVEDMGSLRQLGSSIIRDIKVRESSSGWTIDADGPDSLDELKRKSTLLARVYSGLSVSQIASDLAALAGWTVLTDPAFADKALQCRFDGVSVLRALQTLAQGQGLHLREGLDNRTLELGAFGQSAGLRLVNAAYAPVEIAANNSILLIERLTVSRTSEQIVNWLVPIGGGEGESAITLEHCTRTGPYPVGTRTVGGKTHYYVSAPDSIALYGQIEKVGTFKDINAISNSDADLEAAANALYDAAVAWLMRNKDRIDSYNVSVLKVRRTVRPGDKVRLSYKGFIENAEGLIVNYANIDADLWVLKATERVTLEGLSLDLELATIDQVAQDAAQVVVGAIEAIQLQQLSVQPYPGGGTFVYGYALDATHSVKIPIEISNAVLYLNQCRLFVKSSPFRVLAKAAATGDVTTSAGGGSTQSSSAGGAHRHLMLKGQAFPSFSSDLMRDYLGARASGDQDLTVRIGAGPDGNDVYTYDASADHTHTVVIPPHTHTVPALIIDFGIEDDNLLPETVSILIDGVDATAALGGPWGAGNGAENEDDEPTGTAFAITLDITGYLVNAPGGLRQSHVVEFRCVGAQGWLETTVELRTTIQSITVT